MEFKIGDRVRPINGYGDRSSGIIVYKSSNLGVVHDNLFYGGHTLEGRCTDGHGWFYWPEEIELVSHSTNMLILLL